MRHATGQLSDGLQLLRLTQVFLCVAQLVSTLFFVREVSAAAVDFAAMKSRYPRQPVIAMVASSIAVFKLDKGRAALHYGPRGLRTFNVVGMNEFKERDSHHLIISPSQQAPPSWVNAFEPPLVVEHTHQIRTQPPGKSALLRLLHDSALQVGFQRINAYLRVLCKP